MEEYLSSTDIAVPLHNNFNFRKESTPLGTPISLPPFFDSSKCYSESTTDGSDTQTTQTYKQYFATPLPLQDQKNTSKVTIQRIRPSKFGEAARKKRRLCSEILKARSLPTYTPPRLPETPSVVDLRILEKPLMYQLFRVSVLQNNNSFRRSRKGFVYPILSSFQRKKM